MWPYYPNLLASAVPRYTSYPTAAEFRPVSAADHRAALRGTHGDVSLYIHIPFCEAICFYCGCNTGKAGNRQRLQSYLDALFTEVELVATLLPPDVTVRRVAFGGGSPNAISPADFLRLADHIRSNFGITAVPVSIELDPRIFSPEWARALGNAGVERASLGVQTFASHCQAAIGRLQPEDVIERSVRLLRENGVTSLNFDLMYGLPEQTREDLHDSLARTVRLGADRIALFGYAHVPHLIPRQRVIDERVLPDPEARFAMAELGHDLLVSRGYVRVGFDHFARPGDALAKAAVDGRLRRNFQGFTDDQSPVVIGLGSSAVSSFPKLLVQNEKNSGRYRMLASQGKLTTSAGIARTANDQIRGRLIEKLLCEGNTIIPQRLCPLVIDALQPFIARELVSMERNTLTIRPSGLPYSRAIVAIFDNHRQQSKHRFSSAV